MITVRNGFLVFTERQQECEVPQYRIGRDVFHGHVGALAVARSWNKGAGRKIKKVIVAEHHFKVVDQDV